MIDRMTLQALARLSPEMVLYHVKRVLRNRLSARFPKAYARHIDRVMARVPALGSGNAHQAMAQDVARFYDAAYASKAADAALGRFSFLAQDVDFGSVASVDWHHKVPAEQDFHLWRQKLGHMGFICPMLIRGDAAQLKAVEDFMDGFREQADFGRPECYASVWFPYSASHRILAILSGYLIARDRRSLPEGLHTRIESFLRWNAAFVLANIEHELKNNHVERNLAALCFFYTHAQSVPAAISRRLDRDVAKLIRETILPDGLSAERSAMYQGLSVMALQVFVQTPFLSPATRTLAQERLPQAQRAWRFMTHPDGEIALFNDAWFGEVPCPADLVAEGDFGQCDVLPNAEYGRFQQGSIFALFDAGPIGPSWNPGHGHADFLSVEVDVAGYRFIVDPGTYQYSTGARRMHDRAAESHNGPAIIGWEPVSYKGAFRVGILASARMRSENMSDGTLAGELDAPSGVLRRQVTLSHEVLYIQDSWPAYPISGRVRLLVPQSWRIVTQGPQTVVFARDGIEAALTVTSGTMTATTNAHWACRYLQDMPAHAIDLNPPENADLQWNVSRRA